MPRTPKTTLEQRKEKTMNHIIELLIKAEEDIQYYQEAIHLLYDVVDAKVDWHLPEMIYKLGVIYSYLKYYSVRYKINDDIYWEIPDMMRRYA